MSRFLLSLSVCLSTLIPGAAMVEGQTNASSSYDSRALRLETRPGDWVLIRGKEGEVVGSINAFRGALDLPAIFSASPEAVREARVFTQSYKKGGVLVGLGIGLFGIAGGIAGIDDLQPAVAVSAAVAGTAGVIIAAYGARYLFKASSALSKAVWWYNRDLAR